MAAIPAAVATNEFQTRHTFFQEVPMTLEWLKAGAFFGSILYALIGVVVFWLCFVIIDRITPYNLWEEIVEKQNVALALVVAAMSLGISIIVAAAIHG
jgi:putative membrane protein